MAQDGELAIGSPVPPKSPVRDPVSSRLSLIDGTRFVLGDVVAGRYRIAGLLGKGGMGEVYRADDLKLFQPVALKFLPRVLENDGAALARFHSEVKLARQIAHPNVCRVFDIGEVEGQHFISMEYVDGEDLASLLRRIGRLPSDKAIEIARQLSSGLAAAHEAGVVHRDLKPANIMIDGRGRARITDFGLAGLASDIVHDELRAGTPAYMSPEQILGQGVTPRSDIYSLGLVLYELFSGKRAFRGPSVESILDQQTHRTPEPLKSIVKEVDPAIERLIFQCIDKDPNKRPSSALQIWAALPGGDPLAAALAAGETPSPEMVAAAHVKGALRPGQAGALLASALIGIVAVILLSNKMELHGYVPLEKSPEVLADRAKTMIGDLGYTRSPAEAVFGLSTNTRYVQYVDESGSSPYRWDKLKTARPSAIEFWYRQADRRFAPSEQWKVTSDDPPLTEPGMISAGLDTTGRLVAFNAVPAEPDTDSQAPREFDWARLFALAGLDLAQFNVSTPKWPPPVYSDHRAAWDGILPEQPDLPVHVEAGSYHGKLVHFELTGAWDRQVQLTPQRPIASAAQLLLFSLVTIGLAGSAILAKHNLRRGTGDLRGALRLSIFVLGTFLLAWFLGSNHLPLSAQLIGYSPAVWMIPVGRALFSALSIWLAYIALEPYLRQRWPHRIISWSRVLAGRFRDPLIGRDILIGGVGGILLILIPNLRLLLPDRLGFPPVRPAVTRLQPLLGLRYVLSALLDGELNAITLGLGATFLLLLFFMLLRKEARAALTLGLILGVLHVLGNYGSHPSPNWIFGATTAAIMLFVVLRFGLLAFVMLEFFNQTLSFFPFSSDLGSWSAGISELAFLLLAGLALYGFFTSMGGRPFFQSRVAESRA